MKAFVFDPLWDNLVTEELKKSLEASDIEVLATKVIAPLNECKELFLGKDDRILCVNPDYVNWKLSAADYRDIPNLKAILGAATSTSWIDKSWADSHDVPVCDVRNFSTEAVAEWAIMMLLNVARQTPRLIKDGFPLNFDSDFMKYRGIELQGKRAGVVGLGNIGSAIAGRCAGLGMKVSYWSRSPKQNSYQAVQLEQLMAESDVVFPVMEVNDQTRRLLTDELLDSMKSSAILVSVVHELFNEKLVLDMVENGKLFGFAFEAKPKTFGEFAGNVWAAPSYGWATNGSMDNCLTLWIENMVNAAKGEFPNRVN